nr:DsbA family protein [Sphingobium sp. SYK-6]
MSSNAGFGTMWRAASRVGSALAARTGDRRARRRGLLAAAAVAVFVSGGAVTAYAMQSDGAPSDRAAIEAIVRSYILEHPEIIPEAIERLKAKQVAGKVAAHRSELETPYKGAWEGAEAPRVTLVAFMDYACGYCRASLPDLARLLKENPDLRIVYRELPVITQDSVGAAKVSLLAAEEGRFPAFHQAMYAAGNVQPDSVVKAAGKAGIDAAKARAAIRDDGGDEAIMQNIRLAQALGAEGTPLFVVGDQVFNGSVGYETLKAAIEKARKSG